MLVLGDGPGLFDADGIAQTALVLGVVYVEAGHPPHLFPVEAVALLPNHFHDRGFVLIGPHDVADADLAHGSYH